MRQEDKEVDGPDLERAEERKRNSELVEEREDELYDLDGLPETTLDGARSTEVIAAMRSILERDHIIVNDLTLPQRQLEALNALKTAVEGKDQSLSRFVYAEDRRTLLEQALAVLQPEIASIQDLGKPFEELIAEVGTLREQLDILEDAEEDFLEQRRHEEAKDSSDTDDKDDDDDDNDGDSDSDADGDASLTGPARPVAPKKPTTLGDPTEIADAAAANAPRWRRGG